MNWRSAPQPAFQKPGIFLRGRRAFLVAIGLSLCWPLPLLRSLAQDPFAPGQDPFAPTLDSFAADPAPTSSPHARKTTALANDRQPVYSRQSRFAVPFHLSLGDPAMPRPVEVILHVSFDQGETWQVAGKVRPSERRFTFQAPGDGDYLFFVETVFPNKTRAEPSKDKAGLHVIVDTQPPKLSLRSDRHSPNSLALAWNAEDRHFAGEKTTLEVEFDGSGIWRTVQMQEDAANLSLDEKEHALRIPIPPATRSVRARLRAMDKAGNPSITHTVSEGLSGSSSQLRGADEPFAGSDRSQSSASRAVPRSQASGKLGMRSVAARNSDGQNWPANAHPRRLPGDASASSRQPTMPEELPLPSPAGDETRGDLPRTEERKTAGEMASGPAPWSLRKQRDRNAPGDGEIEEASRGLEELDLPPTSEGANSFAEAGQTDRDFASPSDPAMPSMEAPRLDVLPQNPSQGRELSGPDADSHLSEDGLEELAPPASHLRNPRSAGNTAGEIPVNIVGALSVNLDFELEALAQEDVERLEIWATQDEGRTWTKIAEDHDGQSPIRTDFPSEGRYGIRLVPITQRGFSGLPPIAGDAPESIVIVDVTPPYLRFKSAELDIGQEAPSLNISWRVDDATLAPDSLRLSYSASTDGPWTEIASGSSPENRYHWSLRSDLPAKLYLRIEATDKAGNTGYDVSTQAIRLDRLRPHATLRGISPAVNER